MTVRVVGLATFGSADGLGSSTFTAFTLPGAQSNVTHAAGKVTTIVVKAQAGVPASVLAARVAARLPVGVQAITGQQLTQERISSINSIFLNALRSLLVVFAAIALVVAALTINNTFSIIVAQQTGELALLRAVGASRRQLRRSVAMEAALVGVSAAGLGLGAGLVLAGGLKGLFDAAGFALPAGGLDIRPQSLLIGLVVGVVVTVVAAQVPARRAAAIPPVAALRSAGVETGGLSRRRLFIGAGLAFIGAVTGAAASAGAGSAALAGSGALLLVVGALMLAPSLVAPTARVLGGVLRRVRGVTGLLAEENTRRNPRRTAGTATALFVGVAVVALISVLTASVRSTINHDATAPFTANLAVNSPSFGAGQISPGILTELRALPQVTQAVAVGEGPMVLDHASTTVTNTDVSTVADVVKIHTIRGSLPALGSSGLAISRTQADTSGWKLGTTLPATFSDATTARLTVRAIYDTNQLLGDVVIPSELWSQHTAQPTAKTVFIRTNPGVTSTQARAAINPIAKRFSGDVQDQAQYAAATSSGLNFVLGIVYALLGLAIVIALLGIANTLSLAVHERRREIGLLRAVGETRPQVRSVLRLEAVMVAAFGTLLGLLVGSYLGWSLFEATAEAGAQFSLPVGQLILIAVLGAFAGVLAGWRPARRASRLAILDAITIQ